MKVIKVEYKVKPEYIEQNKTNIQRVMDALRANPIDGMKYSAYTTGDGNSFVHLIIVDNDKATQRLNQTQEFIDFRMALKASEPLSPPASVNLSLVAKHFD